MDILNDELLYTENLSKNFQGITAVDKVCLLYTSPSPRDRG